MTWRVAHIPCVRRSAGGAKPVGEGPLVPGVGTCRGSVTEEVQVADFLHDNAQLLAGGCSFVFVYRNVLAMKIQ
jgi:hypothetical protein